MSEHKLKVGDELAFRFTYADTFGIYRISSITPTGRINCGPYQLNPDLTVRGWFNGCPTNAEAVTDAIREAVFRYNATGELRNFNWSKLTTDQLRKAIAIAGLKARVK